MTEPRSPALAISPENDTAHVGPPGILLPHVRAEAPTTPGKRVITWEFFDRDGRPLSVADDGEGGQKLVVTDPDADDPTRADQQVLVTRIGLALQNAQLRLDALFSKVPPGPSDKIEVVKVSGELEDVLRMLDTLEELEPDPDPDPHPGSWLHRLLDAAFGS
jgi:hypothetical protein